MLFAICADVLLREVSRALRSEEVIRAFADDTAVVVSDYVVSVPVLGHLFHQYERISALSLNISKTIFIPLWQGFEPVALQTLIRELCASWRNISIKSCGKYLGFLVGPGTGDDTWNRPIQEYLHRSAQWAGMGLGLFYNMKIYRVFIATVLSFVMQLAEDPPNLEEVFLKSIRLLAPGPGNWLTVGDATHLESDYSFPCGFQHPACTSKAAKLRVIATIAQDCYSKKKELDDAQLICGRRPFPSWHHKCHFAVLARCGETLREHGINCNSVEKACGKAVRSTFQAVAESLITSRWQKQYFASCRVRQKLAAWKLKGLPAHLESRVFQNFALLREWCPPRVQAAYFRSVWSGWVTDDSMKTLLKAQGLKCRSCVLNCGWDEDSLFHYGRCNVFWQFVALPCGKGLGIPYACRSADAFLLLTDMETEDKVRMALAMYALHRTVQYLRHSPNVTAQPDMLLKGFLNKAAHGSKSCRLLRSERACR